MSEIDAKGRGSTGNVIAALCSVFCPGLGQLVQGRFAAAALFFVGYLLAWCCCLFWAVHLWSIVDAAIWDPRPAA